MRLAVLTLRLLDNYGGLLQAFALQRVLEERGHTVTVWDAPKTFALPWGQKTVTTVSRLLKKLVGAPTEVFREKRLTREYPVVNRYMLRFLEEYIHRTEVADFRRLSAADYDGIVVGSDQIWRPKYCWDGHIERGFLDFATGWPVKRVAYAASFGTDRWEYTPRQEQRCAALLQQFDAVSVRENSGVALCRAHLQRDDACTLLDPTLLLDAAVYRAMAARHPTPKKPGELMVYMLDKQPQATALVEAFAKATGGTPYLSGVKIRPPRVPAEERVFPAVEEWLNDFLQASFVVTDSFHGCIFSILFQKPFAVYANRARGADRFSSLLTVLGLEDRIVSEDTTPAAIATVAATPIDYDRVNAVLQEKRKEAMAFLEKALPTAE